MADLLMDHGVERLLMNRLPAMKSFVMQVETTLGNMNLLYMPSGLLSVPF